MKVCVVLWCVLCLCWRTEADSRSYLITAPLSLRLDAVETILLQLFGFTDEVTVHVFLKTSMAPDHVVLAREVVTLNTQNHHQATAKVRLFPHQLDKSVSHVILHVQSAEINQHLSIAVSRSNGYLFIQTDKPLYTPHQSVKVRAFSLNQELRPANRSVFLTFKDPDQTTVDIVEMIDVNNGIPSMQNPFKIPIKPKLGIWTIEASYSDDFTTTARTDFEVKEYVLPSFSINVEPEANYISHGSFNRFSFKVSARYLHGAPVSDAEVFLRYGYISGKNPPVIIPKSTTRERLSSSGEVNVVVNMQKVLSKHDGPKDLNGMVGKYLYIAVLLEESTGGISQEAEFAAVKFVKSPFRLSLVSTPPFIKPGLPYNIQVLVRDHLDQPVNRVPVRLVERQVFQQDGRSEEMPCPDSATSQSDGLAVYICNTPSQAVRAVLKFETADTTLPAASQATLTLEASAYHSPNQRYLYIDAPLPGRGLEVGHFANIKVYLAAPSYVPIQALSYLVLSKGKVVDFGSKKFVSSADTKQTLSFKVTPAMVPSVRLLVYYILYGAGTSELVADSVWLDVRDRCVEGLQTEVSVSGQNHKPKQKLKLNVRTNQNGLLALSAVDSALFTLRPNYRDPVTMVQRHIERSDQGCGGGGGRDSADVFRLAGLTFITNANAQPTSSSKACTAAVRPKRELTEEAKAAKSSGYGYLRVCCELGMKSIPASVTCQQLAQQTLGQYPLCTQAFTECCEFYQQNQNQDFIVGRRGEDVSRQKRALTEEAKAEKAASYGPVKTCCEHGMRYIPASVTCHQFAQQNYAKYPRCSRAFTECCEFYQLNQHQDEDIFLGRLGEDVSRQKRALTDEAKAEKAASYGSVKTCCEHGMRSIPTGATCNQLAQQAYGNYPVCSQAFTECCDFYQQNQHQDEDLFLGYHASLRRKRALTEQAKAEKAASYGPVKTCCEDGYRYIPKSVTCAQFAQQKYRKYPRCSQAFRECCEFYQQNQHQGEDLFLGRHDLGADFDQAPPLVRSFFPESWLWEVQPVSSGQTSFSRPLPDSLTTWEIKAVGMFQTGMCVAEPVKVSVSLPLSVEVPLPNQVVRGEQLELSGSVYNQLPDSITYCVTLAVGPALCLLQSEPASGGLRSTKCSWSDLPAGGIGKVTFTLLGLEPGEHTLTFTLRTDGGDRDILQKKLRVVPEGVRQEAFSGGRLDPQGLYGSEKRTVELKNQVPTSIVPNTAVERMLTINGEILGEVLSVMHDPEGLRQLVNLPAGSAEAELGGLVLLVQVYQYLETSRNWNVLGGDIQKNSANLRQRIKEGLVGISSFRTGESSYSMWVKREASTWLTAQVVRTLSAADPLVSVDHQALSESVYWLIRKTQQQDGSFTDKSSFRANRVMAEDTAAVEKSVYLTSFVLIALHRATRIKDPILQLRYHEESMGSAEKYITQHASAVKSVYVRAVATYALILRDPNSMAASQLLGSLENLARQKGNPAELRYWQESSVTADWLKPDQSSGLTVETTAYVLLSMLLKGRIQYSNPILSWLTQDQHYGEGFYSVQDTALTLEALGEYSRVASRAVLNQDINVRYDLKGSLGRVQLSQSRPVATPIQVTKNDDIIVSTGYGKGVSNVKMKTVYYQTTASTQTRCNFDITIEVAGPGDSGNTSFRSPHLVACAKYKPPPNELITESSLTVMKIQLPTGVEAYLDDLRQFRDTSEPLISHYELQGNTVVIQVDAVPSDVFLCVGFRIRTGFRVGGASQSLFTVTEPQDKGSLCSRQFSSQEQKLQRLCVGDQCQCMTAACAAYRGNVDSTLTAAKRTEETCRPQIKYAYRVTVKSSAAEGDFMTHTASVVEVLKNTDKDLEAVSSGTVVELVKKATCSGVDLQQDKQYLVMGSSGSEVRAGQSFRYRLPLDSDALVELWPDCSSPECLDYIEQLDMFTLDLQLTGCP